MSTSSESQSEYGSRRRNERTARERLFRKSRPLLRPLNLDSDMWVLWAAYDLGAFPALPHNMNPSQFTSTVRQSVKFRSAALVIDDDCKWFKAGRGPVCLILIDNYGWQIEPYVDYFKWATPRIVLRASVAFFQKIRYDAQVGVCLVKTPEKFANLFNRLKKYGVLHACGKVPEGYPDGDQLLYQVRGKRNAGTHGTGPQSEVQRNNPDQQPAGERTERRGESRPEHVHGEPRREAPVVAVEPSGGDDQQRESDAPAMSAEPNNRELRELRLRGWA